MFDETWIKIAIGVIVAIGWIVKTYQESKARADAGKTPPIPQGGPATEPIAQASEKLNDFLDEIRKRKRRPNSEEEPIVLVEAEPERRPAPKPPIRRDKPAPRITQPSPWAPTAPVVPQAPAKSATDASSLMGSAGVVWALRAASSSLARR